MALFPHPAAASTAVLAAGPHAELGPRIMDLALHEAATPALRGLVQAAPAARSTALAAPNSGLRREVFGFVNAGNLGNATVGYASWDLTLLNTVAYFGLQVNSGDGSLVQTDTGWSVFHSSTMSSFVTAAHRAGVRVLVSINLHDFSGSPTNQVCQGLDPSHTKVTISQVASQVSASSIDGVNVDYEGINTTCANGQSSRAELVSFLKGIRAAMPGNYLAVDTYAGSAADNLEFFDVAGLAAFVDSLFVMAYDMDWSNYHYPPLNCPSFCFSPVSPLNTYHFNDTLSMSQYLAVVPASKVILGLPLYGRKGCVPSLSAAHQIPVTLSSPSFVSPSYLNAIEVPTDSGVSNFSSHRDPGEGVAEWDTWQSSDFNCNREQYWDDVQSLGAKYDLANEDGLRGVGLFSLDYGGGSPELWSSIAAHFACSGGNVPTGDFNGDGKSDLAVGGSGFCVLASSGAAFSAPANWATAPFAGRIATLGGNVVGSGRTDVVAINQSETWVMASTGSGFGPPTRWSNVPFYGQRATLLADVNGDGKGDLVAVNNDSVWVMLSTGGAFAAPVKWFAGAFYGAVTTLLQDVSGDGKADLVAVNPGDAWVMTSTGSGFATPQRWSNVPFFGALATLTADVDGDHKADLIAINASGIWVMTSTGGGFSKPANWYNHAFYGTMATVLEDVTGDGRADVIAVNGGGVWVAPSTGTSFAGAAVWFGGPP
jgi:spore germination protein YaaH